MNRRLTAALLAPAALGVSAPTFAHGLLMKLDARDGVVAGQLYFSNGQRAGGVWVELFDQRAPDIAVATIRTKADGSFRLTGTAGHGYQVRATGEEGHAISMEIALDQPEARGRMIADAGEEAWRSPCLGDIGRPARALHPPRALASPAHTEGSMI